MKWNHCDFIAGDFSLLLFVCLFVFHFISIHCIRLRHITIHPNTTTYSHQHTAQTKSACWHTVNCEAPTTSLWHIILPRDEWVNHIKCAPLIVKGVTGVWYILWRAAFLQNIFTHIFIACCRNWRRVRGGIWLVHQTVLKIKEDTNRTE